jgi:hypothetical protein
MLGVAFLIVLLILQQQQWLHLPVRGRYESAFPDAMHGSWFACVTWILLLFASRWTRGGTTVLVVAPMGLCLAVGTELLQLMTGGDADSGDVFFDMVGMCAALFFWGTRRGLVSSRIGVPVAVSLLIGALWPAAAAYRIDHADADHVYREFTCAPGPCRLQLPFSDLFDRNVARVNAVVIHSRRDQRGRVFYLGRVVLRA